MTLLDTNHSFRQIHNDFFFTKSLIIITPEVFKSISTKVALQTIVNLSSLLCNSTFCHLVLGSKFKKNRVWIMNHVRASLPWLPCVRPYCPKWKENVILPQQLPTSKIYCEWCWPCNSLGLLANLRPDSIIPRYRRYSWAC